MIRKGQKATQKSRSSHVQGRTRPEELIALLDEWLEDQSGYDEETWPDLKKAVDRDRLSSRKLFDE